MSAPVDGDALPRLDEHATDIDAAADDVWTALLRDAGRDDVPALVGRRRPWSSGAPTPAPPGPVRSPRARPSRVSAWPAWSRAPSWRSRAGTAAPAYALVFRLERIDGRTRLRAESRATFPGVAGGAYRLLVVGTGGHAAAVRRLLGCGQAPRGAVDGAALSAV